MGDTRPLVFVACFEITADVAALRVDPATGRPDLDRAPKRIGEFDERAIEEAIRLRDACGGSTIGITLCNQEPPREILLKALAMGMDEVRVLVARGEWDSGLAAVWIAEEIRSLAKWDLVLCGEGSLSHYGGQMGPRLAEEVDAACITYAARLALSVDVLEADRTLEKRVETVQCNLPAVVSVSGEINQPRLPSVLQIMAAGRKPLLCREIDSCDTERRVATRHVYTPPATRKRLRLNGATLHDRAAALAQYLKEEGAF